MARSTYQTYLMHSTVGNTYTKLVDIKDFPDLGTEPDMVETTTLSDPQVTNIPGLIGMDALSFTANYDKTSYQKIKALEGDEHNFGIWFGGERIAGVENPTGDDGKFHFKGKLVVFVTGGGVNEPVNMTITIAASTPIELVED